MSSNSLADLQQLLDSQIKENLQSEKLLGMGAVLIHDGDILALGAQGLRKKGESAAISSSDKWHLGSVTKSMTASLIARLVDKGKLSWDQKLDIIPGSSQHHEQWGEVNLEQLLHHSSGASANFPLSLMFSDDPKDTQALLAARLTAVQKILNDAPEYPPGKQFHYSNVGYTIAAVVAEQITGKSWESLIKEELFEPLGLASAGFGPPQDEGQKLAQPRGHKSILGFKFSVGTKADNPKVMGPAGNVHMNLEDLARYAQMHLQGANKQSDYLSPASFEKLHSPMLNNYAKGWVIKEHDPLAQGKVIWHNGSNTMWYCLLTLLPELNTAIAITVNEGNIKKAEGSAVRITRELLEAMQETKQAPKHQEEEPYENKA